MADITSWLDPKSIINYLDLDRAFYSYPFFGVIFSVYYFCFAFIFGHSPSRSGISPIDERVFSMRSDTTKCILAACKL